MSLAAPLASVATTHQLSALAIGLWLLNTLFFSSAIFTVKLRKLKPLESANAAIQRLLVYHAVATGLVAGLAAFGVLPLWTALGFGIVVLKISLILWQRHWYCTTPIKSVALLETLAALLFLGWVSTTILLGI